MKTKKNTGLITPTNKETFITETPNDYFSRTRTNVKDTGRRYVENITSLTPKDGPLYRKYKDVKEALMPVKEQINSTGDDADLYSTLMAQMIDPYLEPTLVAKDVIKEEPFLFNGNDSIQVPREQQKVAIEINTDGTFASEEQTGYQSRTANIKWIGAYSLIPEQLRRKAYIGILENQFRLIRRAIEEKIDTDILTEFDKATTPGDPDYDDADDDNVDNEVQGAITYDNVIDLISKVMSNDAESTDLLMNATTWAALNKDPDTKNSNRFGTARVEDGGTSIGFLSLFGTSRVHITSQMPDDTIYAVDRNRAGYYINAGDTQLFDGRVNKTVQHEVMAIKPFSVKISNIGSVAALRPGP